MCINDNLVSKPKAKGSLQNHCIQFTKEAELDKPVGSPQEEKRNGLYSTIHKRRTVCDLLFASPITSSGFQDMLLPLNIFSVNCSFQEMQINQAGEEQTGSLRYLPARCTGKCHRRAAVVQETSH